MQVVHSIYREKPTTLREEIEATLDFFAKTDKHIYGEIQPGTIEAFKVQNVPPPEETQAPGPQAQVQQDPNHLANELCSFDYHPNSYQHIGGRCHKDLNNLPSCYSETKRGSKKAWEALQKQFTPTTTFSEGIKILSANKIKMHRYCAMD